jgi:26S proteasome regulatory subunit N4
MLLASLPNRPSRQHHYQQHPQFFQPTHQSNNNNTTTIIIPPPQDYRWQSSSATTPAISTPQPQYRHVYSFANDQPLFDFQPQQVLDSTQSQPLMQSEHSNNSWLENGQLTPRSTTRAHHREPSLSSLGSAGPSSPFSANTSNPQVVGDIYHDFHDFQPTSSKPLTPAHTPSQEQFLTPHYSNFYHNNPSIAFAMGHEGLPKHTGDAELMPAPEFNHSGRPSITSVASHDSPSTPPLYEEEKQKHGETSRFDPWLTEYLHICDDQAYRNTMPKLDRTMTDVYADELYSPNFQITSAPTSSNLAQTVSLPPQNDVFTQRLQAANSQHLSASNAQVPLTITSRDRSPFRQGSPLAPSANTFGGQSPNMRFGTATHLREQRKAESDARALQQQMERSSPEQITPKTISPKDVDLVYHENEEDANAPLFPPQQGQRPLQSYQQRTPVVQEPSELDDNSSQQSYASMATTRRESLSAYSTSSQQQNGFNFAPPAIPGGVRQMPQQYPFVSQTRRQASTMSNVTEDFPATLASMESSSSEYAPESSDNKKPLGASADTGTYTCTYHGCTLRFDTPAKLQRHKREGHRNSAAMISGGEDGGMTSAAQRNSQAGPHKCERINPSTGKPCNTIFSRPYDLTRHEDTIHNARKQKVHCPLCTEEKTFSRNDALTRHLRVVHPEHIDMSRSRRRGGGSHD